MPIKIYSKEIAEKHNLFIEKMFQGMVFEGLTKNEVIAGLIPEGQTDISYPLLNGFSENNVNNGGKYFIENGSSQYEITLMREVDGNLYIITRVNELGFHFLLRITSSGERTKYTMRPEFDINTVGEDDLTSFQRLGINTFRLILKINPENGASNIYVA